MHKVLSDCEQCAEHESHRHGRLYGIVELFVSARAEIPRDHDTGSRREAVEEEHEHIRDHRRRADRRERFFADKIAHNDHIHRVVQHLKGVAQHQRQ